MMHLTKKIKLLIYNTLCKPILEFLSEVWDPSSRQLEQHIQAVHREAVLFIKNLERGNASITKNIKLLNMKSISSIRQAHRIFIFHTILERSRYCLHSKHVEIIA